MMLYVSYFTTGTPYAAEADGLGQSLKKFELWHRIVGIPTQGDWVSNCAFKPKFILGMLRKYKIPIVWIDADARVKAKPTVFDDFRNIDFAYHRRGGELLSGTLYFGVRSERLVERWDETCRANPEMWDQKALDLVLSEFPDLAIASLPSNYVRIFDAYDMDEPVIEHGQASRRLRSVV